MFWGDCSIHGLHLWQCKKKHILDIQGENCSDTSLGIEGAKFHLGTFKGKTSVIQEENMELKVKSNPFIWALDIFWIKGQEFFKFEELCFHRNELLFTQCIHIQDLTRNKYWILKDKFCTCMGARTMKQSLSHHIISLYLSLLCCLLPDGDSTQHVWQDSSVLRESTLSQPLSQNESTPHLAWD